MNHCAALNCQTGDLPKYRKSTKGNIRDDSLCQNDEKAERHIIVAELLHF